MKPTPTPTPRILLAETSRWACGHRLAIVLANAGCEVSAVCPAYDHPLLKTRAVRRALPYSGLDPVDSLTAAIAATLPDFVIPCDDLAVHHLHELHTRKHRSEKTLNDIPELIERSLGPPRSYGVTSSRKELLRIARELGLLTPDTSELSTLDDIAGWQAEHSLPWVLKIDRTWGGRGVRVAKTCEEAGKLFYEMKGLFSDLRAMKQLIVNDDPIWIRPASDRSRPEITVQQYIEGRPANCAVVSWQGEVLAGISVEAVDTQGSTGPATVVRVIDNPGMMQCAEKLARRLGLSGFFGLDFMIEAATGAPYLIEMNPRSTPVCHLQLGHGRDMVAALCARLSGEPLHEQPSVTQNDLIAYFPQAWHRESAYLAASYQDIPQGEPELVEMLMKAVTNRRWRARVFGVALPHFA
jgi:hypothetical protein